MSEALHRMEVLWGYVRIETGYRIDADGWTHSTSRSSVYDYDDRLMERGEWQDTGLAYRFQ